MNFLLLHGGAGPLSVAGFAALLSETVPAARVLAPAHPGFDGAPRPPEMTKASPCLPRLAIQV